MISGLGVKLEQRTIALPNQVAIREAHAINFRAGALCISRGSNQYRTRAALCSSSLGIEQRKASQGVGSPDRIYKTHQIHSNSAARTPELSYNKKTDLHQTTSKNRSIAPSACSPSEKCGQAIQAVFHPTQPPVEEVGPDLRETEAATEAMPQQLAREVEQGGLVDPILGHERPEFVPD
ncbi:hypothetical protein EG328_005402 [Venturia inaequalis]|uniref:Uncharacterized protein n=1 Tax=Venturia inaequalis TaxID=5025 RepID=A0A8H3ZBQ3_VENIN|nr:hypothetical protein EG328_005402 [Venturia inaequalis]